MDIYFLGLTSVRLRGRKTSLVIDPFDKEKTGIKFEKTESDAVLFTERNSPKTSLAGVQNFRVVIDGPGEYEVGGASVIGIPIGSVTTYYIKMDGIALLHLGSLRKMVSESNFDKYPHIDILFVSATGTDMIAKLEPSIVVPIDFTDSASSFLKELGKEGVKPIPKLSITRDKLPAELEVEVLE